MTKNDIIEILKDERLKFDTGIRFVYYLDDNTQIKIYNKNGIIRYNLSVYADKNKYGKSYNNSLILNSDYELKRNLLKKENEDDEFLNFSLYEKEFCNLQVFLSYQLNNKTIEKLIKNINKKDLYEEVLEIENEK